MPAYRYFYVERTTDQNFDRDCVSTSSYTLVTSYGCRTQKGGLTTMGMELALNTALLAVLWLLKLLSQELKNRW